MAEENSKLANKIPKLAHILLLLFSAFYLIRVIYYYQTGSGGPSLLAITLLPIAYIISTLDAVRKEEFYPKFPEKLRLALLIIFMALPLFSSIYLTMEFESIRFERLGRWNELDLFASVTMIVLVLEYARRKFFPIFILNVVLILYAAYGYLVPGMFQHAGIRWGRIITSMGLEMSTGVYADLPQLGLTLIGAFFLVLGVLRGFGCIDSILKWAQKLAKFSQHALPQAAVIGSFAVATVSGSGPANAATTGAATIPALKNAGFPSENAASVETASSLGGQLMPPIMGVTAFLMVDFMGVSYFDVVMRGFGPAIVYFIGVAVSVYLLTAKYQSKKAEINVAGTDYMDNINLLGFAGVILALIFLLGYLRMSAMLAALRVFTGLLAFLSVFFLYKVFKENKGKYDLNFVKNVAKPYINSLDTFAVLVSDIVILLSLLGILTGMFEITGIPTRIGQLMVQAAAFHEIAVILIAFLFGYLVGMGLPPAPVYIMVVLAIAPTMLQMGIESWVIHFFAFFMGVFGHLSPPTSLTTAVTAKIADSDYTRTILRSMESCIPLIILIFAIFTRPELVVELGVPQLIGVVLVLAGTLGIVFVLHGYFSDKNSVNKGIKVLLLVLSGVALFHPNTVIAAVVSVPIYIIAVYGILQTNKQMAKAELPQENISTENL